MFLEKYNLDETSHSADWFNALLPLTGRDNLELIDNIDVKNDKRTKFLVANWTAYTNCKARIANAGEFGSPFAGRWRDLSNDDVRQFLGVIMMDGLIPSPQMLRKFQSQEQDPVQGNNFIHRNCGADAKQRYHMFKHYFGVQDPLTTPPPCEKCPNYKVNEFFTWLDYIWKWDLGPTVLADKQTC